MKKSTSIDHWSQKWITLSLYKSIDKKAPTFSSVANNKTNGHIIPRALLSMDIIADTR